jgi:hypothetical protein
VSATPFTIRHELEPAYLLGSFSLRAADKGFVVVAEQTLQPGRWSEQGMPFYGHGVSYQAEFAVKDATGRFAVELPSWYGSVARVMVNGRPAGYIAAPPWQCDVTGLLRSGANMVEVVVFGTLKNTLGPHHGTPVAGTAWPRHFQVAPKNGLPSGRDYDTIGYGLFAPFVMRTTAGLR